MPETARTNASGQWQVPLPKRSGVSHLQVSAEGYKKDIRDIEYDRYNPVTNIVVVLYPEDGTLAISTKGFDPVKHFCKPGYWVDEAQLATGDGSISIGQINIFDSYQGNKILSWMTADPGKDGIPYSGDELAFDGYYLSEYSKEGSLTSFIYYTGRGPDLQWGTEDDFKWHQQYNHYNNLGQQTEQWEYGSDQSVLAMSRHLWDAAGTQETVYEAYDRHNDDVIAGKDGIYGTDDDIAYWTEINWYYSNSFTSLTWGSGPDYIEGTDDDPDKTLYSKITSGPVVFSTSRNSGTDRVLGNNDDFGSKGTSVVQNISSTEKIITGWNYKLDNGNWVGPTTGSSKYLYDPYGNLLKEWRLDAGRDLKIGTADDQWLQYREIENKYDEQGRVVWGRESDNPGSDRKFFTADDPAISSAIGYPCPE